MLDAGSSGDTGKGWLLAGRTTPGPSLQKGGEPCLSVPLTGKAGRIISGSFPVRRWVCLHLFSPLKYNGHRIIAGKETDVPPDQSFCWCFSSGIISGKEMDMPGTVW